LRSGPIPNQKALDAESKHLLERGADPVEADAEERVCPAAWAEKKGHAQVAELLQEGRRVHKIA